MIATIGGYTRRWCEMPFYWITWLLNRAELNYDTTRNAAGVASTKTFTRVNPETVSEMSAVCDDSHFDHTANHEKERMLGLRGVKHRCSEWAVFVIDEITGVIRRNYLYDH